MTTNMTTKPKPVPDVLDSGAAYSERTGAWQLKLSALGIDHLAPDFPARFIAFCEQNDDYEMEMNADGDLIILPMTGFRGNRREMYLAYFLTEWELNNGGVGASQTSRFRLPSGEIRGPDAAWLTRERYDAQTPQQRETVIEGAPDFVVEIRSRTDRLRPLQDKMALWMAAGARLGWLIDAANRQAHIYRTGQSEPAVLDDPETLDGADVLPGFVFPVRQYVFDLQ